MMYIDIVEVDTLLNPLYIYRFSNIENKAYLDNELIYFAEYDDTQELAIELKESFILPYSPSINSIEKTITEIKKNRVSGNCQNKIFFKNEQSKWIILIDGCFGWSVRPRGDVNSQVLKKNKQLRINKTKGGSAY